MEQYIDAYNSASHGPAYDIEAGAVFLYLKLINIRSCRC